MEIRELFGALSSFFNREKIEYAVIGAYALYSYGYVRATRDIDFVVPLRHQQKVCAYLESLGFETVHCSDAFSNHVHPVGNARVDCMYVQGPTEQELFAAAAKRVLYDAIEVCVVAPLHLLAMKLFSAAGDESRRSKDIADLRELIKAAQLDKATVREAAAKYGMEGYLDQLI